jgi:hypothetical protein
MCCAGNMPSNRSESNSTIDLSTFNNDIKVKVINNPKAKWTDLSVKSTFGGILVAAEHFKKKSVNGDVPEKVTLLHVGGKAGAIKWDVAQYKNEDSDAGDNAKFDQTSN